MVRGRLVLVPIVTVTHVTYDSYSNEKVIFYEMYFYLPNVSTELFYMYTTHE